MGHSLIHLGYAYELHSRTIGIEALAMVASFYDDQHKYLDDPSYTRPASYSSTSIFEILKKVAADPRFHKATEQQHETNLDTLLLKHEAAILDHWNAWDLSKDPMQSFQEAQKAAVAMLVATGTTDHKYDFYLVHVLTTSHATRTMLPIVPPGFQIRLIRQWWFFALTAYVLKLRPEIDTNIIDSVILGQKTWKNATYLALHSSHAHDSHYVKAIRAMNNAAETWTDRSQYFLKAGIKFSEEFSGWKFE